MSVYSLLEHHNVENLNLFLTHTTMLIFDNYIFFHQLLHKKQFYIHDNASKYDTEIIIENFNTKLSQEEI